MKRSTLDPASYVAPVLLKAVRQMGTSVLL